MSVIHLQVFVYVSQPPSGICLCQSATFRYSFMSVSLLQVVVYVSQPPSGSRLSLNSSVVVHGMTVKLRACGWGYVMWKAPFQEKVWIIYYADIACTFECALHYVKCDTVTVSPNQIIVIIIIIHERFRNITVMFLMSDEETLIGSMSLLTPPTLRDPFKAPRQVIISIIWDGVFSTRQQRVGWYLFNQLTCDCIWVEVPSFLSNIEEIWYQASNPTWKSARRKNIWKTIVTISFRTFTSVTY